MVPNTRFAPSLIKCYPSSIQLPLLHSDTFRYFVYMHAYACMLNSQVFLHVFITNVDPIQDNPSLPRTILNYCFIESMFSVTCLTAKRSSEKLLLFLESHFYLCCAALVFFHIFLTLPLFPVAHM